MNDITLQDIFDAKAFLTSYANDTPPPTTGVLVSDIMAPKRPFKSFGAFQHVSTLDRGRIARVRKMYRVSRSSLPTDICEMIAKSFNSYELYQDIKDTEFWQKLSSK